MIEIQCFIFNSEKSRKIILSVFLRLNKVEKIIIKKKTKNTCFFKIHFFLSFLDESYV